MGEKKSGAGRPKQHTDEFIEKVADDLEAWSEKDNSYSLTHFIATRKEKDVIPEYLSRFAKRNERFYQALQIVRSRVQMNRDRMVCEGKLPQVVWARQVHIFDKLTVEADEEIKDRDSERKRKENSSIPHNDQAITQMLELQKENAELKKKLHERNSS